MYTAWVVLLLPLHLTYIPRHFKERSMWEKIRQYHTFSLANTLFNNDRQILHDRVKMCRIQLTCKIRKVSATKGGKQSLKLSTLGIKFLSSPKFSEKLHSFTFNFKKMTIKFVLYCCAYHYSHKKHMTMVSLSD